MNLTIDYLRSIPWLSHSCGGETMEGLSMGQQGDYDEAVVSIRDYGGARVFPR